MSSHLNEQMTSLKGNNLTTSENLKWPRHLTTPTELMQALKQRTKLRLIKSPICSKIILQFVGSWSYLLAHVLNKTRVINIETFRQELRRVEDQTKLLESDHQNEPAASSDNKGPLLTLSNHISCIDDPILWASLLPFSYYTTNTDSVRWSAAAVEICFSKPWHSTFFSLGKTFPIIRGIGINQPAMDFASGLLRCNQWLHLFPEGKVMRDNMQQIISNKERGYIFKWGISKLILDYFKSPEANSTSGREMRILPFYHLGLDEILPIGWPYIPRFGKRITILIRPTVIEMNSILLGKILAKQSVCPQILKSQTEDVIKRIKLTNFLEEELEKLAEPAARYHSQSSEYLPKT